MPRFNNDTQDGARPVSTTRKKGDKYDLGRTFTAL